MFNLRAYWAFLLVQRDVGFWSLSARNCDHFQSSTHSRRSAWGWCGAFWGDEGELPLWRLIYLATIEGVRPGNIFCQLEIHPHKKIFWRLPLGFPSWSLISQRIFQSQQFVEGLRRKMREWKRLRKLKRYISFFVFLHALVLYFACLFYYVLF